MVELADLKVNNKYFISMNVPTMKIPEYKNLSLRVIINYIEPKSQEHLLDYVTFTILPSSKDLIDARKFNQFAVPLPLIIKKETLHDILNTIFIDDIIYLINEYI